MKERAIIMRTEEVCTILAGRKTQARRVVSPPPRARPDIVFLDYGRGWWPYQSDDGESAICNDGTERPYTCPYGQPRDRLWVKEAFSPVFPQDPHYNNGNPIEYDYKATYQNGDRLGDHLGIKKIWKPAIHMPREASRITLEVVAVRVEQIRSTSVADAIAEGFGGTDPIGKFADKWNELHGGLSWAQNPWVLVIEFQKVEQK